MKNKNLKKICVQEVPTVHGIGTGKTPPKLKLLTQIPALERQNAFVENMSMGDYLLFIFIVCFEK